VKLYEQTALKQQTIDPDERLRRLALLISRILSPVPQRSLGAALQHLRHAAPDLPGRKDVVARLLKDGEVESAEVAGVRYLWPAGRLVRKEPENVVRFLAPFDPIVWDRRRFEYFWGWPYRFEAYTPPAKRKLGYYAMPLLWRAEVIGWVNASRRGEELTIEAGFAAGKRPSEKAFQRAFEEESQALRQFFSSSAQDE
jgi:uncharacterized protein YcaQ